MFDHDKIEIELLKNRAEHQLLQVKASLAAIVERTNSNEEARLFLAAALVRLGLVPGEPQEE